LDDVEAEWTWQRESFDFIFMRDPLYCIRDFPRLIRQAFDHLKPGGWIEFECIYGILSCDDGTLPEDSYYAQFGRYILDASIKTGTPLTDAGSFKHWFEEAGFETAVEVRYKIPGSPWPKDERLKLLGVYELENFLTGLEGMSMRIFTKGLGWSKEELQVFLAGVRKDMRNRRYHGYYP
jgi:SAM-dependent methyltransferase